MYHDQNNFNNNQNGFSNYPPSVEVSNYQNDNTFTGNTPSNKQFNSFSVYGSKAALCFNLTDKDGRSTINVDGAAIIGGQRRFDWQNKVSLMVTESELPFVLSVLYGWLHEFEGRFHGPQKNKSFKIINQQGKIFFSVSQAGQSHSVPIGGADAFYLLAKIMGHISKDYPGVSISDLSFILQATTVRLSL